MRKYFNVEVKESVDSLITTRWSQYYPYTYEGIEEGYIKNQSFTAGCVAIGGAQFMMYHRHPEQAEGIIPAYSTYPEKNIDGFKYEWDSMPVFLSDQSSQNEIIATSTLILDVGLATKSYYGPGTPAKYDDLAIGLVRNFKYDKNIQVVKFKEEGFGYTLSEITELVKRDLNMGFPVMTSISGHFIVCDGYKNNEYLSFNWGWGGAPRHGTLESVGANAVMLGGRPAEDECLQGEFVNADFDEITPGKKGTVTFNVINSGDENYSGQYQVILADKFNVARSLLSSVVDLDIKKGESKDLTVPVEFKDGFSFGQRSIQVLYAPDSGIPRPLRDHADQIVALNIKSSRPVSKDVCITNSIDTVDSVAEGDDFDVHFYVRGNVTGEKNFSVYLVDSNLNKYYELGSVSTFVKQNQSVPVLITCSSENVESETSYRLMVVENDNSGHEGLVSAAVPDLNNNIPLADLYVRNPNLNIGDEVELISNFDLSSMIYAEYFYETDVEYKFINPTSGAYYIQLSLTDENGNIIVSEQLLDNKVDKSARTAHFKLQTPRLTKTQDFNLQATYINLREADVTLYLTPSDVTIINPAHVSIVYRNFYDFIFLSSSLLLQSKEINDSKPFKIESDILFSFDHTTLDAGLVSIRVILEDTDKKEYEVGVIESFVAYRNTSVPISIDCQIPSDISKGNYNLYLRATDFFNGNGEPNKKILKLNDDIVDELEVIIK